MGDIKERQRLSWEGMFYSIKRIDLLIISICSAGIYICFETIKYLSENAKETNHLVKISGVLFTIGIIINFISQLSGYKANEQDFLMCEAEIDAGTKISKSEKIQIEKFDKASDRYSKWTIWFNYASMGLMFLGLLTIMYYFIAIF